jgi:hypothetical protein
LDVDGGWGHGDPGDAGAAVVQGIPLSSKPAINRARHDGAYYRNIFALCEIKELKETGI